MSDLGDASGPGASSLRSPEPASGLGHPVTPPIASEMAERVADVLLNWGCGTSDECEHIASGILATIREPTDRQVMAALAWALDWMKENGVDHLSPYEDFPNVGETTRGMWRAMVDAAGFEPR
jgi:hypothetical protein